MRWPILSLSAILMAMGLGMQARGQVDPNAPQGPNLLQQLQENMNNAGVTPQDLIQQARDQAAQNGGQFDPQAFMQNLQQQGVINQNMLDQVSQMRNQFQNQMQQRNQQQRMSSLQVALNSPDDEWSVLGPKVQRVIDLKSDLDANKVLLTQQQRGFGGGGGFGGGQNIGGGAQSAAQTPLAKALSDLQQMLADVNSPDANVAEKLAAVRQARLQDEKDLTTARQELLTLVTLRQEAVLLNMELLN